MKNVKRLIPVVLAVLLSIPLVVVHGAGGRIEGKVTDPKGAAIPGATVKVTNQTTKQDFSAVTDAEGRYKVEGLSAGVYDISITAKGFRDRRQTDIKVADDAVKAADVQLEIGAVEAEVKVSTGSHKGNLDPVYQSVRQLAKVNQDFNGDYAVVNNLTLKRDAANFNLKSGELYFITPVEGRTTAAVFIGNGELTLTPPTYIEKNSIKIFTGEEGLTEQFSHLVLRFTDKTLEEIKSSPNATVKSGGAAAAEARDLYRSNQELLRKRLHDNRDLRTLYDLYNPAHEGYFNAFIDGKRFSKLIFLLDPFGVPTVSPEEVALISFGETDGGIWTAFHREEEHKRGSVSSSEDRRIVDITHHEIDAAIKGSHLTATDRITFKNLIAGTRVVPFDLFRTLRVTKVQDSEGNELDFVQEGKDDDADLVSS